MYDVVIIGGGIVGLSTAMSVSEKNPKLRLAVIEKESAVSLHQSGNNSGVIHSGIYYTPGSYKASLAKSGNEKIQKFCQNYKIPYDMCGKIIVATNKKELKLLDDLHKRGLENELKIELIEKDELANREPHVSGLRGLYVPQAGIVSYPEICRKMAEIIQEKGGEIILNTELTGMKEKADFVEIETNSRIIRGKIAINCAGLYSDRVAKLAGYNTSMKIIPFRGEYYALKPEKEHLVKNLIYPVPNPKLPFLGVHFTRMIDGSITAGPNAVLALKREAYKRTDINIKETLETLLYPGFWKLGGRFFKDGASEYIRSFSKKIFTKSLQELIPEVTEDDLVVAPAGVRAQAIAKNGKMVDDFEIIQGKRSIHVCNAPSPAATASIGIGQEIAKLVDR